MAAENIIIGGGGSSPTMEKLFLDMVPKNGRVLLCSLASENLEMTLTTRRDWIKAARPDVTMGILVDGKMNMNGYDAIIITGGNTRKLYEAIHQYGLAEKFDAFRKSGRTIYGSSAGAIVMGRNIGIDPEAAKANDVPDGFDWLGGLSVASHWPDYYAELTRQICRKRGLRAICCPEDCGAIFDSDGNLVKIIGNGVEFIE